MKRFSPVFVVASLLFFSMVSCVSDNTEEKDLSPDPVEEKDLSPETGLASHITCRGAEISGKANVPTTTSADLTFGILYSTSSGVLINSATKVDATSFDSEFNFTVQTEVLEPETTYYYRSFTSQLGAITYGDTKSFTTLPVSSMIKTEEATDVKTKDAILSAVLDLTDCVYDSFEYGFELAPADGTSYMVKSTNHSSKKYSFAATDLQKATSYTCKAYVTLDGRTYNANEVSFKTEELKGTVSLNDIADITELKATVSGALTIESEGSYSKSAKLYYSSTASTLSELKSSGTAKALSLASDGSFSVGLTELKHSTKYYYVVAAQVDEKEFVSEVRSFSTASFSASVSVNDAADITEFTASISGTISVTSIEILSRSAKLYYSSTANDVAGLKSSGTATTLSLSDNDSFSAQMSELKHSTKYYYVVVAQVDDKEFVGEVKSFGTKQIIELVDLGLSVKWRSWNLGASSPEESGLYYQWGDTEGYGSDTSDGKVFMWSSYKWGNASNGELTKYNYISNVGTVDNKTVLEMMDDAARAALGGKWRIPTEAELLELKNTDNCSWTWTTINGVKGYKVQSKKSGYTDKWIFLPVAGRRSNDKLEKVACGYYWSSSLDKWYSQAATTLQFNSTSIGATFCGRIFGNSIRPVSK